MPLKLDLVMNCMNVDIETIPTTPTAQYWTPKDEKEFPPIHVHKPIVICYLVYVDKAWRLITLSERDLKEYEMLKVFISDVDRVLRVSGWNSRKFDLPVIAHRAFTMGLPFARYYQDSKFRYRYSRDAHWDLKDDMSDYGSTFGWSMDIVAKSMGLPGKMDTNGSQVYEMYKQGRIVEIEEYCMTDVIQSQFIQNRLLLCRGDILATDYIHVTKSLYRYLQTLADINPTIQKFLSLISIDQILSPTLL